MIADHDLPEDLVGMSDASVARMVGTDLAVTTGPWRGVVRDPFDMWREVAS